MDICTNCNGRGNTGLFFWTKKCKECDGFGVTHKPEVPCSKVAMPLPQPPSMVEIVKANLIEKPKKKRKKRAR